MADNHLVFLSDSTASVLVFELPHTWFHFVLVAVIRNSVLQLIDAGCLIITLEIVSSIDTYSLVAVELS